MEIKTQVLPGGGDFHKKMSEVLVMPFKGRNS